ncbi:hypothetical protein BU16DRAFT_542531 [Lophium mytilinum]|uniref:Uncharacterized protein n=1 Tax=Lophium mytilinum TaxID=390894 RepID=A0A6A6QH91_9PEZI|nr:hypothetical protein BU16DRAFT_542531 [Lophium mytilinum]
MKSNEMEYYLRMIASMLRVIGLEGGYDLEASLGPDSDTSPVDDISDSESNTSTVKPARSAPTPLHRAYPGYEKAGPVNQNVVQAVARAWEDVKSHSARHAQLAALVTLGERVSDRDYAAYWAEHQKIVDHFNFAYLSISEPIDMAILKYIQDAVAFTGAKLDVIVRRVVSCVQTYDANSNITAQDSLDPEIVNVVEEVIKKGVGQVAAKEMVVAAAMRAHRELVVAVPTTPSHLQGGSLPGSRRSSRPFFGHRGRPNLDDPRALSIQSPATPHQPGSRIKPSGRPPRFNPGFVTEASRATRR